MGDGRSLPKLATEYRRRSAGGQTVPTRRQRQLETWSSRFNWQVRVKERIAQEAAEQRAKTRQRAEKFRDRMLRAIEIEGAAFAQTIFSAVGPDGTLSKPQVMTDAASTERLVKLFFQLAETPLGEQHDLRLSGDATNPVRHEHFGRLELTGDAALAVVQFHESIPATESDAGETDEARQPEVA